MSACIRAHRQNRGRDGARRGSSPRSHADAGRARRIRRVRGARAADIAATRPGTTPTCAPRLRDAAPLAPAPDAARVARPRRRSRLCRARRRAAGADRRPFRRRALRPAAGGTVADRRRAGDRPRRARGRRPWRSTRAFTRADLRIDVLPARCHRSRSCISTAPPGVASPPRTRASSCRQREPHDGGALRGRGRRDAEQRGTRHRPRRRARGASRHARRGRGGVHLGSAGRANWAPRPCFANFALVGGGALARRQIDVGHGGASAKIALGGVSLIDGARHADTTLTVAPAGAARREPRVLPPHRRRRRRRRLSGQGDRRAARAEDRRRHEVARRCCCRRRRR